MVSTTIVIMCVTYLNSNTKTVRTNTDKKKRKKRRNRQATTFERFELPFGLVRIELLVIRAAHGQGRGR